MFFYFIFFLGGGSNSRGSTITATNHDDQLIEMYATMLNEFNCTFGISFSRFHCCGRHGIGSNSLAMALRHRVRFALACILVNIGYSVQLQASDTRSVQLSAPISGQCDMSFMICERLALLGPIAVFFIVVVGIVCVVYIVET